MNEGQAQTLAATVEVLSRAIQLMFADDIRRLPPDEQDRLLDEMTKHLASPGASPPMQDRDAVAYSDLVVRLPEIATRWTDGVRARLGRG